MIAHMNGSSRFIYISFFIVIGLTLTFCGDNDSIPIVTINRETASTLPAVIEATQIATVVDTQLSVATATDETTQTNTPVSPTTETQQSTQIPTLAAILASSATPQLNLLATKVISSTNRLAESLTAVPFIMPTVTPTATPPPEIITTELITSENWIVERLYEKDSMIETLHVRNRSNDATIMLSQHKVVLGIGSVETVPRFFSPDGQYFYHNVVTFREGSNFGENLQRLDLQTQETIEIPDTASTDYTLLPDKSGYAHLTKYGFAGLTIRKFDGNKQRYDIDLPDDTDGLHAMRFSNDQTRLAFESSVPIRGGYSYVGVYDLLNSEIIFLTSDYEGALVGWCGNSLEIYNSYPNKLTYFIDAITGDVQEKSIEYDC